MQSKLVIPYKTYTCNIQGKKAFLNTKNIIYVITIHFIFFTNIKQFLS